MNKKTTFILGAGASAEFGFPIGSKLFEDIILHLNVIKNPIDKSDYLSDIRKQLFNYGSLNLERGDFDNAINNLLFILLKYYYHDTHYKINGIVSIDHYINRIYQNINSQNDDDNIEKSVFDKEKLKQVDIIIKLSIAYLLFGYEERFMNASARVHKSERSSNYKNWVFDLALKINQVGLDYACENIQIITFNYERTLQYLLDKYLFENEVDGNAKKDFISKNIHHVYGHLGSIYDKELSFGIENNREKVFENPKKIKLIFSHNYDGKISDEFRAMSDGIQNLITESDNIYFMGFGFLKENLEVLGFNNCGKFGEKRMLSTSEYSPHEGYKALFDAIDFKRNYCESFIKGDDIIL